MHIFHTDALPRGFELEATFATVVGEGKTYGYNIDKGIENAIGDLTRRFSGYTKANALMGIKIIEIKDDGKTPSSITIQASLVKVECLGV